MVFNATFNNISVISWRSALLVGETGVPKKTHGGGGETFVFKSKTVNAERIVACVRSSKFILRCIIMKFIHNLN